MERETDDVIAVGAITMRFLVDGKATDGHMAMAELVVQPQAKVPPPHRHDDVDETIRVVEGALTYRVDEEVRVLQPGDHFFSPRGSVHHFSNQGDVPARAIVVFSPASIGPQYFHDVAGLLSAGGPPDLVQLREVMQRHGIAIAS
jgi:quercetin dioxygenase-like cupin family protein